jgi:hypothetical protein
MSLVRERTGKLFAMKRRRVTLAERLAVLILRKTDMLGKGQEGHVRSERDVESLASTARVR